MVQKMKKLKLLVLSALSLGVTSCVPVSEKPQESSESTSTITSTSDSLQSSATSTDSTIKPEPSTSSSESEPEPEPSSSSSEPEPEPSTSSSEPEPEPEPEPDTSSSSEDPMIKEFERFAQSFESSQPTKVIDTISYSLDSVGKTLNSKVTYLFNYDNGFVGKITRTYDKLNTADGDDFITSVTETYYLFDGFVHLDDGSQLIERGPYAEPYHVRNIDFSMDNFDFTILGNRFVSFVKEGYEDIFMGTKGCTDISYNLTLNSDSTIKSDSLDYCTSLGASVSSSMAYSYTKQNITIPNYGV